MTKITFSESTDGGYGPFTLDFDFARTTIGDVRKYFKEWLGIDVAWFQCCDARRFDNDDALLKDLHPCKEMSFFVKDRYNSDPYEVGSICPRTKDGKCAGW